jgi:serine phosphatase RsbU (regulator of sigma subunit)
LRTAREVQQRLLPRSAPRLDSLDCAGGCLPAGGLGGDYYDYLETRPGHVGFALGDISGKGVTAALMMASLQASLRSHYATENNGMAELLRSVNDLLCECTADRHYATLFLGDYDDATGRLRYANCGHVPPLLVHADGRVDRLAATAMILGAFEEWSCAIREVSLVRGDVLLLYTDGVTEATGEAGQEFGESGLLEALRASRHLPVSAMSAAILGASRGFAGTRQRDDMTLVVARPR